jgi:hypothetical protein
MIVPVFTELIQLFLHKRRPWPVESFTTGSIVNTSVFPCQICTGGAGCLG